MVICELCGSVWPSWASILRHRGNGCPGTAKALTQAAAKRRKVAEMVPVERNSIQGTCDVVPFTVLDKLRLEIYGDFMKLTLKYMSEHPWLLCF